MSEREFWDSLPKKLFDPWVRDLYNIHSYPETAASNLALELLKLCTVENRIDDPNEDEEVELEITKNGFALLDYTIFCFYFFRARIQPEFSRSFLKEFDECVEKIIPLYFRSFFDIQSIVSNRLMRDRKKSYDIAVRDGSLENFYYQFAEFIERDFVGSPEMRSIPVMDFTNHFFTVVRLRSYSMITLSKIESRVTELTERKKYEEKLKREKRRYRSFKIFVTFLVLLVTSMIQVSAKSAGIMLGAIPTIIITSPLFFCIGWCFKKTPERTSPIFDDNGKCKFIIFFKDGTSCTRELELSEEDSDAISYSLYLKEDLNENDQTAPVLQKAKMQFIKEFGSTIESVEFIDPNHPRSSPESSQ